MALRTPLSVTPHLYMGDSTGRPLDKGVVYFGEQDKDPEFYPIELFSDDALTKPLMQPVHTKGGYLYDKGDMVEPHAKELIYSVKVLDSYGRKVFYKGAMMRNSWNDDVIEQINTAIIGSADVARQVATDITNEAINNTAVEGGVLADTFVTVTANGAETIPRTQRDKNAEQLSVKDFGAVGDGVANDTIAIQKAIDYCAGKCKLLFPSGVYMVDASVNTMPFPWTGGLKVKSGSFLIGDSGAVIKAIPNNLSKYFILSIYGQENVRIEGLKVEGDRDGHIYDTTFSSLEGMQNNIYINKDNYRATDNWNEGDLAYIRYDTANAGTYKYTSGEWVKQSTSTKNYYTHEFGFGIAVLNSKNVWINNCEVSDCTGDSIYVSNYNQGESSNKRTTNVFITNNVLFRSRRQGISVVEGSDILIDGNTIKDIGIVYNRQGGATPKTGIDIEAGTGNKSIGVVITNNTIKGCVNGSIFNFDGYNVVIANNVVDNSISYGYGFNTIIANNILTTNAPSTTLINGNSSVPQIDMTYTYSEGVATITTASAYSLRVNDFGYFDFKGSSGATVIEGNFEVSEVVSSTVLKVNTSPLPETGSGKYKAPDSGTVITGNRLVGGGISCMRNNIMLNDNSISNGSIFCSGSTNISIKNNTIKTKGDYAISVISGAKNVTVAGNSLTGASSYAIRMRGSASSILNNAIYDSHGGVEATNSCSIIGNAMYFDSSIKQSWYAIAAKSDVVISSNNIEGFAGNYAIKTEGKCIISDNNISYGLGGIDVRAGSSNTVVRNNTLNVIKDTVGSYGLNVGTGVTGTKIIGNTFTATNAQNSPAIRTYEASNSLIVNNVHYGSNYTNETDTLVANVAY